MKAYLIDPHAKTVEAVEHNGDYRDIYRLIDAELFTTVQLSDDEDTLFVDDEGILGDLDKQAFFYFDGYPNPLAGKGLVLGTNDEGESVEPKMSIEELRAKVTFNTEVGQAHAQVILDRGPQVYSLPPARQPEEDLSILDVMDFLAGAGAKVFTVDEEGVREHKAPANDRT